jgi:hypothetical protein
MSNVGIALVVGGMALVCSCLIFLLPNHGRRAPPQEPFEESQRRLAHHLREMQRDDDEA